MIRRLMLLLPAFFAALLIHEGAFGRNDGYGRWERLGVREIGLTRDFDVIPVGRHEGGFRQIKLNVRGNAIRVDSLVVVYVNGAADRIPMRAVIRPQTDSRLIDLRGGSRRIRHIEMILKSIPNGRGRARVEVWGRR